MGSWEQEKYSQSYTDEEFENKGETVKPKSWNLIWKSLILITETLKKKFDQVFNCLPHFGNSRTLRGYDVRALQLKIYIHFYTYISLHPCIYLFTYI